MQFWETIINTAMMGTDRSGHTLSDIPADLASLIESNTAINKEEKFLQLAALAYNYRMSGVMPLKQTINIPAAEAEEKSYCSQHATQVLKDILSEENIPLLQYWLEHCAAAKQIVQPELLPSLLAIGVHQKKLQPLIAVCCGKRGEWLSQFKTSWNFSVVQTDEEFWHNGTFEQRKQVLTALRKTDPEKARALLEATWAVEDANTKTGFLELLHVNVGETDITFLENLATEKSKKVKEEALELLKKIPSSTIIQSYVAVLKQAVSLIKEKALLGLISKTTLQFRLPADIPEEVFKSGIDKLSNNKKISDEAYILHQLIAFCPPSFWEEHLQRSPAEVMELFSKFTEEPELIWAVGSAATRFNNSAWASIILKTSDLFFSSLVPVASKAQGESYLARVLEKYKQPIFEAAVLLTEEWGMELARAILKYIAHTPHFNKMIFNRTIHLIPAAIIPALEGFTPQDEYGKVNWNNNSAYLRELIQLKTQTQKAFNA